MREQWTAYFEYLDALRKSGITNMFAAGPHIAAKFDLPINKANAILKEWIRTFSDEESAFVRAEKVTLTE